jgi:hypothetical protein
MSRVDGGIMLMFVVVVIVIDVLVIRAQLRKQRLHHEVRDVSARMRWLTSFYALLADLTAHANGSRGDVQRFLVMHRQQADEHIRALHPHVHDDIMALLAALQAFLAHIGSSGDDSAVAGARDSSAAFAPPAINSWWWWRKAMLVRQLAELNDTRQSTQALLAKFEATLLFIPASHTRYADVEEAIAVLQQHLDQLETHVQRYLTWLREAEDRLTTFAAVLEDGTLQLQAAALQRRWSSPDERTGGEAGTVFPVIRRLVPIPAALPHVSSA